MVLCSNFYNAGFIIFDDIFQNILFVKGYLGWGLPKGYYEKGDKNYCETAIREVKEEIGVNIKNENIFDFSTSYQIINYNDKDRVYKWGIKPKGIITRNMIFYVTKIKSDTKFKLQKSEIKDIKWISINEITDVINKNKYSINEKKKLIKSINIIKSNFKQNNYE
jgi:8-oxo-dGTP pyrophosphatase MutT (NUDIX family)